MARIKIDFNKPVTEQVAKSRDIQTRMDGNPNFAMPDPTLADVKTATDELETAYNEAQNNDKEKKAVMRIKRKVLKVLIVLLADYVQKTSGGDEEIILSSGFGVRKTPSPIGLPPIPQGVRVLAASQNNELVIVWEAVKGAKSYIVDYNTDPLFIGGSGNAGICTKGKFKAINLLEGTKYWFRIFAINAAGKSGWSDLGSGRTL
jgi:hypothetical protein